MTTPVLFTIRRMLAMVAIIAGMCASLRFAGPGTVLVMQAITLIAAFVLTVLAISGSPRMRRFCIAALGAGLIHLFVFNLSAIYELAGQPVNSPTSYCCRVLYDWVKDANPSPYAPPSWATPAYPPSPYSPIYAPSVSTYPPPTLVPTPADPSDNADSANHADDPPEWAQEPVPQPLPPAGGAPATVVAPAPSPGTPVPVTSAPSGVNVYPSYTIVAPVDTGPDWLSFEQVGSLDATLLVGIVAGSAAVMLDEMRRRRVRSASERRVVTGS